MLAVQKGGEKLIFSRAYITPLTLIKLRPHNGSDDLSRDMYGMIAMSSSAVALQIQFIYE